MDLSQIKLHVSATSWVNPTQPFSRISRLAYHNLGNYRTTVQNIASTILIPNNTVGNSNVAHCILVNTVDKTELNTLNYVKSSTNYNDFSIFTEESKVNVVPLSIK